ncbi:MAG: hypothetical protein ACI8Z5_001839 [Lentimonas sp.]|jgi:hypothetical protein
MPISIYEENSGNILVVHLSGQVLKIDYAKFSPEFERLVRLKGKLDVLFDMTHFNGWDAAALWEDIKFDFKHFYDIERLAIVGDEKWQECMSKFSKLFTNATVKYFDHTDATEARKWLGEV